MGIQYTVCIHPYMTVVMKNYSNMASKQIIILFFF